MFYLHVGDGVWWEKERYKLFFSDFCNLPMKDLKVGGSKTQAVLKPLVDTYIKAEFTITETLNYWSTHQRPIFVKKKSSHTR